MGFFWDYESPQWGRSEILDLRFAFFSNLLKILGVVSTLTSSIYHTGEGVERLMTVISAFMPYAAPMLSLTNKERAEIRKAANSNPLMLARVIAVIASFIPPVDKFTAPPVKRGIGKTVSALATACKPLVAVKSNRFFSSVDKCVDWIVDNGLVINNREEFNTVVKFIAKGCGGGLSTSPEMIPCPPFIIIDDADIIFATVDRDNETRINAVRLFTLARGVLPEIFLTGLGPGKVTRPVRLSLDLLGEVQKNEGGGININWFTITETPTSYRLMPLLNKYLSTGAPGRQWKTFITDKVIQKIVNSRGYLTLMSSRRIKAYGEEETHEEEEEGEEEKHESWGEGGGEFEDFDFQFFFRFCSTSMRFTCFSISVRLQQA